jgi:hypothetical protein
MEVASKFKIPRMSTDREDSTAAKDSTPFMPRRLLTQAIYFRTSLQNMLVITPNGTAWESSILRMHLRREPLPLGFWIAGDAA